MKIWTCRTHEQFMAGAARAQTWHRWFAWHPVLAGDEWVWLEFVERIFLYKYGDEIEVWEYRA